MVNTMIAIGIGGIPGYARLVRGEVLTLLNRDHVMAARSIGATNLRLMTRHILPLAMSSVLVYSTAQLARAILTEAGLSFLGLGIQPPNPLMGRHDRERTALVSERARHGDLPRTGDHGHGIHVEPSRRQPSRCIGSAPTRTEIVWARSRTTCRTK